MLNITGREQFLLDMQAYLMNGGTVYGEKKVYIRTQQEALDIMNDRDRLLSVDIIRDELAYHDMAMKTTDYFKKAIDELLVEDENGYTKEERLIFDEGLKTTFFDNYEELLVEKEEFIEWASGQGVSIKIILQTVNERIAVVIN